VEPLDLNLHHFSMGNLLETFSEDADHLVNEENGLEHQGA